MAGVYNSFEIKCENENDAKKAKQIAEKIISESNTQIETESDLWNPIDTNATTINAENYERFDIDDCYLIGERAPVRRPFHFFVAHRRGFGSRVAVVSGRVSAWFRAACCRSFGPRVARFALTDTKCQQRQDYRFGSAHIHTC